MSFPHDVDAGGSNVLRKLLIGLGVLGGIVLLAATGLTAYVTLTWDKVYDAPLPNVRASTDPAVIAAGEYLVYGPAHCVHCHSASFTDYVKLGEGVKPPLVGGTRFGFGPVAVIYSKNLTPDDETGIGRYTDGQLARMLRSGVRPNGRVGLGMGPFDKISDSDVVAIVSFLRSQSPVRRRVPEDEWFVFGKVLRSTLLRPRTNTHPPVEAPPPAVTRERGEYLARSVSDCPGCHTNRRPPTFAIIGAEFSGGLELEAEKGSGDASGTFYRTPNLTPAKESALDKFPDRDTFVARFLHGGRKYPGSPMPWESFSRMTTEDLGALYEFLHSLAPQPGPTGEPVFKKATSSRPS
ncbi:MAG TPA: hypothetical protein VNZ26_22565 [Vicinamibacterales bacterium]|jgi:mono/diheme cytochrome c family protein|nr:hypothetical protein [Vicinamibacterales bacterium]